MMKNGWTEEIKRLRDDRDCLLDICRMILDSRLLSENHSVGEDYQRLIESAVIRIGGKL